ncbi:MAG TPA: FtsX-like permease family protein, partial [Chloroflexota bacterium]|nr:FtsX-like permease family protein [Chloroflexota bacterium]
WPEVSAAIGVMNGTLVRETEGRRGPDQPAELMAITGVEGDPSTISGMIDLSAGRWLRGPSEVVVGPRLSREKGLTPGQPLRLSGQTFTIVGTGKMRGLGYGTATDAVVYMDYQAFRQRADLGDVLNLILIQSTNPQAARQGVAELGNLASLTTADLVARAEEVNASSFGIYVVFIVLTLGVAALFVANMLARSVAERRLEFATLAAIGVPTRTILFTVGAEALAISLVASIFGMGLSLCLGALLNSLVAPQYSLETMYVAQPSLFGFVLFLAMVLGVLAGLLPARQATRVEPVEVLREA